MGDLIAAGEAWFEQQRRQHLATQVEYRPTGGLPRFCAATLVVGRWERMDASGQLVRFETRDFFLGRSELPQDPQRGDTILVTEDGATRTYEVFTPEGASAPWAWGDRAQKVRRVHTIAKASTPATPPAYLVRFTGSSRATAITDAQIAAGLTAELAAGRAISRSIACDAAYIYVVLPSAWVATPPVFRVNGLVTTAFQSSARSAVFEGQPPTLYTIYRSIYPVTGTVQLEVA